MMVDSEPMINLREGEGGSSTEMVRGRRILCLPGYGQNKSMFKGSNLRLWEEWDKLGYEVDILEAPFVCFNSGGNTQAWWYNLPGQEEKTYQQQLEALQYVITYLLSKERYEVILGFSQGGAMLAILTFLLTNPTATTYSLPSPLHSLYSTPFLPIFAGSYLPTDFLTKPNFFPPQNPLPTLSHPSLHLIGQYDTIVLPERSHALVNACGPLAQLLPHSHAHVIPSSPTFLQRLQQVILTTTTQPQPL